jgi:uncharacterized membrane protein
MTTIYFLHVLLAFATVGFLVIPGVMLEMVARTRDVTLIRRMFQIGRFHGQIGGPISLLTGIVGLVVAWRLGIPLNAGWLLATYVAFVLVNALGVGYHARREIRISALAQTSPADTLSPSLAAAIDDPLCWPIMWVSGLLWIFIIWLMVAKPF